MIGVRAPLHVKLLRDLWRLRGQSIAIALVIAAGVGMVVMSFGMIRSLEATRAAYYDLYRFADVFAPLRRAPESLMDRVRALPGVNSAESRVTAAATLDVSGVPEPIAARVHSLPPSGEPALNKLVLRTGRLPDTRRPLEVVVNEAFAKAARLSAGDRIGALLYGKRVELQIVGTVLSPEYVYAVAPGQIFPDNRRFGTLWMGREPLAAALDLNDAFNDVVVRLQPGAESAEVVRRLDLLLAPYGGAGAYDRDLQISHRFVSNEMAELATMVEILPPIFLAVAAFLLNIVLGRLVETEREVIGLLKAFGYRNGAIMLHYAQLALLLAAGGLVIGVLAGTWLGHGLATRYQEFFVFPFLEFRADAGIYLVATLATLAAVLVGALAAVRRAARLTPAEAMRPPAPADFSRRAGLRILERMKLDEPSRMVVRGLVRRPLRSALTIFGLSTALALYIASASSTDSVERMIDLNFTLAQREDVAVTFAEARGEQALFEISRIPGVLRVEPFRAVGARLRSGPHVERDALVGREPGTDLNRLIDMEGRTVEPPDQGVLISNRLASDLQLQVGDRMTVEVTEGQRPTLSVPVVGVIESPLGGAATMSRGQLNRLLGEGNSVSGAYVAVDPGQLSRIYDLLKRTPAVAGVNVQSALVRSIRETLQQNLAIVVLFNTGFAGMIVLGVVYNSARISLSERARDLASMRVLGFRRGEVSYVLLGEQALLLLLSLPIGLGLGLLLSRYMMSQLGGDLYTIPYGTSPATLGAGVLLVAAASFATAWLIKRRVDRLDLVRALKTRE